MSILLECADAALEQLCEASCVLGVANETEDETDPEENVALAFLLVTAAGMSTAFGSAMVLCNYVNLENSRLLGAALGFSAGVMIYVSFVEILQKSVDDFTGCDCLWNDPEDGDEGAENAAKIMATICFFGGVAITYALDMVVHFMFDTDGTGDIFDDNINADKILEGINQKEDLALENVGEGPSKEELHRMGIMTALAIGLHNFPEGLATFVATLSDPSVGAALAVAIAIHNIPEGLCVAVPVFYATGSRAQGFIVSAFSGVTEIIGALMGWLFLRTILGPATYAALFGIVAGMMTTIVLKELIPTAHKYDPEDKYVSAAVIFGAFFMALSLVLFLV